MNKSSLKSKLHKIFAVSMLTTSISGCALSYYMDVLEHGEQLSPQAKAVTLLAEPYESCADLGGIEAGLGYAEESEEILTNYLRHIAARDHQANAIVLEKQEIYEYDGIRTLKIYAGAYKCE